MIDLKLIFLMAISITNNIMEVIKNSIIKLCSLRLIISSLFNKYHGNPSSGTVYVELDIVETSKKGVEQIQENICK